MPHNGDGSTQQTRSADLSAKSYGGHRWRLVLSPLIAKSQPLNETEMSKPMENPLDLAWEKINAIGGTCGQYDDFGKGINHAVEQALFIIEELGGADPLPKRAAARQQVNEIMALHDQTIAALTKGK